MRTILFTMLLSFAGIANAEIIHRQYEGFELDIDCDLRGAIQYHYTLGRDKGDIDRKQDFEFDPEVPARCQQTSTSTYKVNGKSTFDRGHGVPANHIDNSELGIKQTNFMVNIWPQHRDLNRGAMKQTELIAECYRDIEPLEIYGGIIAGATPANSDYLKSHGIVTPGYFYKLIVRKDRALAWILPNKAGMKKAVLDKYLVSVADLEKITGKTFPMTPDKKKGKPEHSWMIPRGCGWS
ncbi:DNA/RNA non-specific endonuclease [Vibrio vulnificus]|uniref:DNA/RNA non-specific endonuclease n=1 Tax=Vibrio vulnificus TaxID=672 RepID=UPI002206566E|nr:DNA/RNA non-specific endonuclease [Vibrio vulnificus]BDP33448.1 endonuclease [Vibrio vulnificus]